MDKLVQLLPSGGWVSVYEDGVEMYSTPLVAWGLTEEGEVIPLDTGSDGDVDDSRNSMNFKGVFHREHWHELDWDDKVELGVVVG